MGIFSVVPPTVPRALRSTQPLKAIARDFSWDKGDRCVWLTIYHPCSAKMSRKSGALTYPEPLGPPRPVAGDLYFTYYKTLHVSGIFSAHHQEFSTVHLAMVSCRFDDSFQAESGWNCVPS